MDPMDIDTTNSFPQSNITPSNSSYNPSPAISLPAVTQALPQQPDIYQPLPSHPSQVIRLISISLPLPPTTSSLLTTHLEVHPLDSAPPYNAISYVWGNPGSTASDPHNGSLHAIVCNNTLFPVTPNLHWALHRAAGVSAKFASFTSAPSYSKNTRTPHQNSNNTNTPVGPPKRIYLWPDAICINQSDLSERSSQVSFMGSIYARAQRVLVCMGDPPPTSPPGSNYALANLVNTLAPIIHSHGGSEVPPHRLPPDTLSDLSVPTAHLAWQALAEIMNRPWFRRVWVIQEVSMPTEKRQPVVLYGPPSASGYVDEFGYRDLMVVVEWAKRQRELVVRYGVGSLRIHGEWAGAWSHQEESGNSEFSAENGGGDDGKTFYDLVDHASLLSCRDPRDRIYAFLGHPLAPRRPDGTLRITPDYTKDVNELYLELAKVCLEGIIGVRALVTAEHTEESLRDGFPSWMTRWHVAEIWNNISRLPEQVFSAGGADEPGYRPVIQGGILMLEGAIVEELWKCFPVFGPSHNCIFGDAELDDKAALQRFLSFLTSENVPSMYGNELSSRLGAFAMTVCAADASRDVAGPDGIDATTAGRRCLLGLSDLLARDPLCRAPSQRPFDSDRAEAIAELAFCEELSAACAGRSFAITKKGWYCLVPKVAREGDQICVVRRLDVPVLMRVEGTRLALLGEAYVFGLMHGKAMEMVQRGELVEEVFVVS